MAFNKLRVFDPAYMPFRKVLWSDADTLVLHNIDHLLRQPMFTAAFTYACCNGIGPVQPSGGLWVVEPSAWAKEEISKLMSNPIPGTERSVLKFFAWEGTGISCAVRSSLPPPELLGDRAASRWATQPSAYCIRLSGRNAHECGVRVLCPPFLIAPSLLFRCRVAAIFGTGAICRVCARLDESPSEMQR